MIDTFVVSLVNNTASTVVSTQDDDSSGEEGKSGADINYFRGQSYLHYQWQSNALYPCKLRGLCC